MGKTKLPYAETLEIATHLAGRLESSCARIEIAGSLRRKCAEVGDIELVAIPKTVPVLDMFGAETGEVSSLLWGRLNIIVPNDQRVKWGEKYRQFVFEDTQVDLFTATPKNFGWIYLIRTGSADFSHGMAARLNERGLTSKDGMIVSRGGSTPFPTPEEEDVFRLAGRPYVKPEERQG